MAFFKDGQSTSNARLRRVEQAVWVLIYGGLLTWVLAYFMQRNGGSHHPYMVGIGGLAILAGVVLIYVRSRLYEDSTDKS